ncbi:MAG: hypothetical protein GX676_08845 [Bacilli bacterium]|nr:hypothetical protein [Bacilli bacterium]
MDIKKIIPFLDDESLNLLVDKALEGKISESELVYALPFLSQEHITKVYQAIVEKRITFKIEVLLPFMSEALVEDLYSKVINKETDIIDEAVILPFLKPDKIKSMFINYINKL